MSASIARSRLWEITVRDRWMLSQYLKPVPSGFQWTHYALIAYLLRAATKHE